MCVYIYIYRESRSFPRKTPLLLLSYMYSGCRSFQMWWQGCLSSFKIWMDPFFLIGETWLDMIDIFIILFFSKEKCKFVSYMEHGLAPVHLSRHDTNLCPIFVMCLYYVGSSALELILTFFFYESWFNTILEFLFNGKDKLQILYLKYDICLILILEFRKKKNCFGPSIVKM